MKESDFGGQKDRNGHWNKRGMNTQPEKGLTQTCEDNSSELGLLKLKSAKCRFLVSKSGLGPEALLFY